MNDLENAARHAIDADTNWDRLRIDTYGTVSPETENIIAQASRAIDAYRTFVWLLAAEISDATLRKGVMQQMGRKGGKQPKPSRRNPKLLDWIRDHRNGRTAGELYFTLMQMKQEDLPKAIGQDKHPSSSTIDRYFDYLDEK